jgi:hypothetical protein
LRNSEGSFDEFRWTAARRAEFRMILLPWDVMVNAFPLRLRLLQISMQHESMNKYIYVKYDARRKIDLFFSFYRKRFFVNRTDWPSYG